MATILPHRHLTSEAPGRSAAVELPHDTRAEATALGAVLVDNHGLPDLIDVLPTGEEWHWRRHGLIYEAIRTLAERGSAVDLITLKNELESRGTLEDAGGIAYVSSLVDGIPKAMNVRYYAKIVREHWARRRLLRFASEILMDPRGADLSESLERVRGIISSAAPRPEPDWTPYPVEVLPAALRRLIEGGSTAIGCDPSYVAVPLMAVLAACIGNTRRIQLKRGWFEPAVIWSVIIGESGTRKSPPLDLVLEPLRKRQAAAVQAYREAMEEYERARKNGEEADEPSGPERYIVSDVTVEAVVELLAAAPRGLLLERDELAGWIASYDRYTKGGRGGSDVSHWLAIHGARHLIVDRKTSDRQMVCAPRAAISVTGGVQPETLRRRLGREHFEDGLAARLLVAMPPRVIPRWTEAEISREVENEYASVVVRLQWLSFGEEGEPIDLPLTGEAQRAWIAYYDQHAGETAERSGDLAAAWSKLEGYAARLALVIHCARWAAEGSEEVPGRVDEQSIAAGIALSRWHGQECERVYAALGIGRDAAQKEGAGGDVLELLRRRGSLRTRDLMRSGPRRYRGSTSRAEAALAALVDRGVARWVEDPPGPRGGAPSRHVEPVEV